MPHPQLTLTLTPFVDVISLWRHLDQDMERLMCLVQRQHLELELMRQHTRSQHALDNHIGQQRAA